MIAIELTDPDFVAHPYPVVAAACDSGGPIPWHDGLGLWVTTTHSAANDVLRDRSLGRIFHPRATAHDDPSAVFDWLHATRRPTFVLRGYERLVVRKASGDRPGQDDRSSDE